MVDCEESVSADINFVDYRDQRRRFAPYSDNKGKSSESGVSARPRCFRCKTVGHYARHCKKGSRDQQAKAVKPGQFRQQQQRSSLNAVYDALEKLEIEDSDCEDEDIDNQDGIEDDIYEESLNNILGERKTGNKPALVNISLENKVMSMEIDTGAGVSVCAWQDYKKNFAYKRLHPCDKRLKVISGDQIKVMGQIFLRKVVNGAVFHLPLIVVKTRKPFTPLLGRSWLSILTPDWRNTFEINRIDSLKAGAPKFFEQQQLKRFKKNFGPCLMEN